MKRRTQLATLLSLGGALLMGGMAHAQGYPGSSSSSSSSGSPGSSSSSGGYPGSSSSSSYGGGQAGANDAGAVNSSSTTTIEQTTSTDNPTPNTGGEPLLMSLFGTLTASSALFLRRKLR